MSFEAHDHAIFEIIDDRDGKKVPMVTSPHQVVQIHDRDELEKQLAYYQHPFLKEILTTKPLRKRYVEKIRPALRYYCRKFGVDVPKWLAKDDFYTKLPEGEKEDLFGTSKLSVREFAKINTGEGEEGGDAAPQS